MQSSKLSSSRRAVIRPFILTLLVMLAAVMGAALLPRGEQTGIIANLLLTVLILCPLALCLFPVYLLLMFMVIQLQRAHSAAAGGLSRLGHVSISMNSRVERILTRWTRRSIRFNSWFARLDRLAFGIFDRPQNETDSGKDLNDFR
jgi:preprotein translocase subunit SecG